MPASGSTTVAQKPASEAHNRTTNPSSGSTECFNFTVKTLDSLKPPPTGRLYYKDETQPGLRIAVYPSGKKTFILYRKVDGRPERLLIGPFPDVTIEQARKEAQKLKGQIALGGNPAAERRAVRDEMTLEDLFDTYLRKHAKQHKKTWAEDERQFNCYLRPNLVKQEGKYVLDPGRRAHPLSRAKLSDIERSDITALHSQIGTNAPVAANRLVKLLCKMFNFARDEGWKGDNPAARIKPNREKKRSRFLQEDELQPFFSALAQEPDETLRDYLLTLVFTGARKTNTLQMKWANIHWDLQQWEIPQEEFKNDEPMFVELHPVVVDVLRKRQADPKRHQLWVFPGRGETGHLVEPKAAWQRLLDRLGNPDLRVHDLRRTHGSWQTIEGGSLITIGAALGHKDPKTTQVYARLSRNPVRESVHRAVAAMLKAGKLPKGLLPAPKRQRGAAN